MLRSCVAVIIVGIALSCVGADDFTKVFSEESLPSRSDGLKAACKIRPSRGSGVNTSRGVLTCWHCVSEAHKSNFPIDVTCDDETMIGSVIASDVEHDLALLAVPWKKTHETIELATANPAAGAVLWSIGRGRNGFIEQEKYTVSAVDAKSITTDPSLFGGQSGSGMINAAGQLVGIAKLSLLTREPWQGQSTAIEPIRKLLASTPTPIASAEPVKLTLYVKPNCRPGDAICQRCVDQSALLGTGNDQIAVKVSTETIPAVVTDRLRLRPGGYLYPVIVWERDGKVHWIAGPGIYSLDQVAKAVRESQ